MDYNIVIPSGQDTTNVTGDEDELSVVITSSEGNYTGSRTVTYRIVPKELSSTNIKVYNGADLATDDVLDYKGDGTEVTFGRNLRVECDLLNDQTFAEGSGAVQFCFS